MNEPLTVFARLNGMEAPSGVYGLYIPDQGWCVHLCNRIGTGWFNKKAKNVHLTVKPWLVARYIKGKIIPKMRVVDLLTLKTWTSEAFVAEFGSKYVKKPYKRQRGPCPRCNRVMSINKNGKNNKHACLCRKCWNRGGNGTCEAGCPNENL